MQKPFTQITFDFTPTEIEKEENHVIPATAENIPTDTVIDISVVEEQQPEKLKTHKPRGRRSLKDAPADDLEIPTDDKLFQKLYYPIGEVAEMFRVNQSLLRYWESEFSILKPKKNGKGDRFFRPEDVKNLKLIHYLLRERKYTMEGTKEFLKDSKFAGEKHAMIESLEKIKLFLLELKNNL